MLVTLHTQPRPSDQAARAPLVNTSSLAQHRRLFPLRGRCCAPSTSPWASRATPQEAAYPGSSSCPSGMARSPSTIGSLPHRVAGTARRSAPRLLMICRAAGLAATPLALGQCPLARLSRTPLAASGTTSSLASRRPSRRLLPRGWSRRNRRSLPAGCPSRRLGLDSRIDRPLQVAAAAAWRAYEGPGPPTPCTSSPWLRMQGSSSRLLSCLRFGLPGRRSLPRSLPSTASRTLPAAAAAGRGTGAAATAAAHLEPPLWQVLCNLVPVKRGRRGRGRTTMASSSLRLLQPHRRSSRGQEGPGSRALHRF